MKSLVTVAIVIGMFPGLSAQAPSRGDSPQLVGKPQDVDWETLGGLDYVNGEMTPRLQGLKGRPVRIPGFMVPLDDDAYSVTEFLLVPYVGACVHTPPPPPNQIVYVKMREGLKLRMTWWDPIWIHGNLEIHNVDSPFGEVGYQIVGVKAEPYVFESDQD